LRPYRGDFRYTGATFFRYTGATFRCTEATSAIPGLLVSLYRGYFRYTGAACSAVPGLLCSAVPGLLLAGTGSPYWRRICGYLPSGATVGMSAPGLLGQR